MKKIHFIIISLLCSVATMAQKTFPGADRINPEIKKLMKSLDSLHIMTELRFDRDAKQGIRFIAAPQHNRIAHEVIMKTIKRLAHESTMTNHYEVHKDGMDTIEVCTELDKKKDEYFEYRLCAFPLFKYNCTIDDKAKSYKFVDAENFMAKVKPLFWKAKVLSCHKAVYEHDGDYKNGNMFVMRQNHLEGDAPYNSHIEATIYKIIGRKKTVKTILNELIDLVWKYTDKHKDLSYYEFQPFAKFIDSSTTELIQFASASKNKGARPQSFHIVLYKERGKEVYYFAFLKTDGDLWLPHGWTTVEHSKLTNNKTECDITGQWKCSDQTLRNLGVSYHKMNGKIDLRADSTFTMTVKGRGLDESPYFSQRTVIVKLNGTYSIKDNRISFCLERNNVQCHINDDKMDNDPTVNQTIEYKMEKEHSTWDASERRHETARDQGDLQEEFLEDDIYNAMLFTGGITMIDSNTVQIGSTMYLTR